MVDTAVPSDRRAGLVRYGVERLRDSGAIRALLAAEGPYAAYALAQLAPRFAGQNEWWAASGPGGRALVLHSRGGLGRALVTVGDPAALDALLSLHPAPRVSFASFRPEHRDLMHRHYSLTRKELMVRMQVTKQAFRPVDGAAVRLSGRDIGRINRLYSSEGGPAAYASRHIDEGVYYGVIVDTKLVSIAGTHVDSPEERVAVVGNVFTHPRFRGRGLATVATSAVTDVLLEHCDFVALTVEASNVPALAIYGKLGYRQACTLYETPAARRDSLGAATAIRRLIAAWRGRGQGRELAVRRERG